MHRIILFSILSFWALSAGKPAPIVVPLETIKTLPTLYFSDSPLSGDIEADYKEALIEILREDIENSYHFDLTMGKVDIEPLIGATLQKTTKELTAFKSDFVLLPKIEQKNFVLKLFEPRFHTTSVIGKCQLKGSLKEDRLQIHLLFDQMHQKIFHQSGIASTKILYCKKTADVDGDWVSDIYEITQDGGVAKKLTSSKQYLITPMMIPKTSSDRGYDYIYVSYEGGQPKIHKTDGTTKQSAPLIPMRGNQLLPTFSPMGDKIAFICDASGKTDLFFQQYHPKKGLIGKPIQLFSKQNSTQASPSFSPCGSKIAFVSDKDGMPKIYILEIIDAIRLQKTPQVRLLTPNHRESTCPAWSPDGKKIAFSATQEGFRQIWVLDLDKKVEVPITSGPLDKENPSWAPDSIHLVYNTTGQESQIYTIDIVKQKPVKLTDGEGIAHFPTWEQR
ncbi:MAG: hypothetical protein ACOYK9_04465 [Chlamydiia bacterium]